MSLLTLRYLQASDESAFFEAFNDDWEEHFDFVHYWVSLANEDFSKYISIAPEFSRGLHIPQEHVPVTLLFAFNTDGEIVGRISIRHELTPFLLKEGGHIGYGVCPKHRRKGHATEILKAGLDYIRINLDDIEKVLLTCNKDNIASRRTIENNQGVLDTDLGGNKLRYWITL